jgi:uncharacterized integral membrane protein
MSNSEKRNLLSEARDTTLAFAIRLLGMTAAVVVAIVLAVIGACITVALILGFIAIPDKSGTFVTLAKVAAISGVAILGATATGFLVYLAIAAASFFKRRRDDLPPVTALPTHELLEELRRELDSDRKQARLPEPTMGRRDQIVDTTVDRPTSRFES